MIVRLGGLTKITGLVVDPVTKDCILVGEKDPALRELRLDDLVIMLRSVFLYHDADAPGVTINPHPDDPLAGPQQVVYFGHIEGTRAGYVCFRADELMKRIGLCLERSRVAGVQTYFEAAVEEARRLGRNRSEVLSRFWYYPVVSRVVNVGNGVLLDECQLAVLTEVLSAQVEGEAVRDLARFYHDPSERYARSFSDHFDELAQAWPVIQDLRGLSAMAAVTRQLTKSEVQPDLDYWLHTYEVPVVETPTEVPLQQNVDYGVQLAVYGGVRLESLSMRLKEGDVTAFSEAVLQARRTPDALMWHITVTSEGDIFAPPPMDKLKLDSAADAYVRGHHLFRGGRYDLAIACWLQVTRTYPEMGEAYHAIGRAFERKGMPACAADYYTKAMQFDPFIQNLRRWSGSGDVTN